MDVLDIFLKKYSYKFPKGYPDMNNEQDILIMEGILSELGVNLDEVKKSYSEIIKNLLSSEEASGKLGTHSKSQRVKNIGNISNNDFIDILSNVFDVDTKDIKMLPPKAIGNPSSGNFAFQFPIEDQEVTIVLGTEARGTAIEDYELSNLNNIIAENGGSIDIKVGDKIYEDITKVEKILGNKQADFIFIGKDNLYIQHKDLKASQQLSGVKKLESNPEVKDFVQAVKDVSGGSLQSKMNFKRKVTSSELQLEGAYGVGDKFGIDKVQSIMFGNIELKPSSDGTYFELSSPVQFDYPQPLNGDYTLYIFATYRSYGLNQQGIKNARFGFYPEKYYKAAKEI
jgi:hypothetical protein